MFRGGGAKRIVGLRVVRGRQASTGAGGGVVQAVDFRHRQPAVDAPKGGNSSVQWNVPGVRRYPDAIDKKAASWPAACLAHENLRIRSARHSSFIDLIFNLTKFPGWNVVVSCMAAKPHSQTTPPEARLLQWNRRCGCGCRGLLPRSLAPRVTDCSTLAAHLQHVRPLSGGVESGGDSSNSRLGNDVHHVHITQVLGHTSPRALKRKYGPEIPSSGKQRVLRGVLTRVNGLVCQSGPFFALAGHPPPVPAK